MAKMIERMCLLCGNNFFVKESQLKHGRGKYCSVSCKGKVGRSLQDTTGNKNPNWKDGASQNPYVNYVRTYKQHNPEKVKCHDAVKRQVKNGTLKRRPCQICGVPTADAHHEDYNKPQEVIWLCRKHHNELHRKTNPARTG